VPQPVTRPTVKVRVGNLGTLGDGGFTIGLRKGYYAEQGVDIELVRFDSGALMVAPLSAGQLDVGAGTVSAGLFNAVARGVGLKCILPTGTSTPGHGVDGFVVRTAIADQIKTAADLKGRKVAVAAHGIVPEFELATLLEQAGLSMSDVDEVLLPFPEMVTALGSGSLDVGILPEPFVTQMTSQNVGKVWMRTDSVIPTLQIGCLLFGGQFVASQPAAAQGFATAFLHSVRDYDDAFIKNDPQARAEIVPILIETTSVKDPALYQEMTFLAYSPDGKHHLESLANEQEFFLSTGQQQQRIDLAQLVDTTFAENAARQLGPYN
jgi:NitT/TauT family transport system substrate-binding protein